MSNKIPVDTPQDWSGEVENYVKFAAAFTNLFGEAAVTEAVHIFLTRMEKKDADADSDAMVIRYLDIATGTGAATFATLKALCKNNSNRSVSVLSTDLSPAMLKAFEEQVAAKKIGDLYPNVSIESRICDMQDLSSIPDHSIDIISNIFSILFPPDPVKALKEVKRVLAPGGVAVVTTWQWNSLLQRLQEAAFDQGKVQKLADFELPYGDLANEHNMRIAAKTAGFSDDEISCSFIQKSGAMIPNFVTVHSANANPALKKYAPYDTDKLTAFLDARADGVHPEYGPYQSASGTALCLKIGF